MMTDALKNQLAAAQYTPDARGIYRSGSEGYWSNLDREENRRLIAQLETMAPRQAIHHTYPQYEQIIYSPKREAALELLDIQPGDVCIDYGCMWGVLSCGMAKRGGHVLAIDQTYESLAFLEYRRRDEHLDHLIPVQQDIRQVDLPGIADCAVVNGVLEWVPEMGEIELKKFYGKKMARSRAATSPKILQQNFLQRVHRNLKPGGKLLLAIENRYDLKHFLGLKDPHANLHLTAVVPRVLANAISHAVLKRPYVNYLYSFPALKKLLFAAGFSRVDLFMAFPDYRYPELILPYERGIHQFRAYASGGDRSWKRKLVDGAERAAMQYFKMKFFAPSIVAIATQ